jgi:TRAP-type C4-dicarboxylate transport system permease small subunit
VKAARRFYDGLSTVVRSGAEVCVFGMIGLLFVDVVGRYVFSKSTLISYDMTGYFLVGITYLGAAYGLTQGSHIKITVLTDLMRASAKQRWELVVDLIALFFTAVLWWKSVDLVRFSLDTGIRATSFMGEPMWIPQLLVPIGLGLLVVENILELIGRFRTLSSESMLGSDNPADSQAADR